MRNESENYPLQDRIYLPLPREIFQAAWDFWRHHWRQIFKLLLWPAVLSALAGRLVFSGWVVVAGLLFWLSFVFGLLIIFSLLNTEDRQTSGLGLYQPVRYLYLPALELSLVGSLIVWGAFLLLLVPGLVLVVDLSFALFILAEKREQRWPRLLSLSWEYVRGFWWAVFGRLLALILSSMGLILVLLVSVWLLPGALLAWVPLLIILEAAVLWFVIVPVGAAYWHYLYLKLKEIKPELEVLPAPVRPRHRWLGVALVLGLLSLGLILYAGH